MPESTLYFKVGRPLVDGKPAEVDIAWGLASEAERRGEKVFNYVDLSVSGRYSTNGIMDIRDGNIYKPIHAYPLDTAVWYELWFVINHQENQFDLYIRGGSQFPDITQVFAGARYRLKTQKRIDHLVLIATTGSISTIPKGIHPAYFDDFYVYAGKKALTDPDEDWICLDDFESGDAAKWKVNLTGGLSSVGK